MKRTTRAEIDEMIARGYEAETIQQAKLSEARTREADLLCESIRAAFAGVKLGKGIGLFEAHAIDDHETAEVRGQMRAKDEKGSWELISLEDLISCSSSLSFFDSLGMRFHLPAFIFADLKDEFGMGLELTLTRLNDHGRSQFTDLSTEQRKVVRAYLLFLREEAEAESHCRDIDRALANYWSE